MQVGGNRSYQCPTITSWHNHPITGFSCALTHIVYVCHDLLEKAALEILKRLRLMGRNLPLARHTNRNLVSRKYCSTSRASCDRK
jgi:hypothetical protein